MARAHRVRGDRAVMVMMVLFVAWTAPECAAPSLQKVQVVPEKRAMAVAVQVESNARLRARALPGKEARVDMGMIVLRSDLSVDSATSPTHGRPEPP